MNLFNLLLFIITFYEASRVIYCSSILCNNVYSSLLYYILGQPKKVAPFFNYFFGLIPILSLIYQIYFWFIYFNMI